ncbi:hypothetical protein [Thermopirellula anaerolimosa]
MKIQIGHSSDDPGSDGASPPVPAAIPTATETPTSATVWELGGEFHWVAPEPFGSGQGILPQDAVLFGNGRQALYAAFMEGRRRFGWRVCHLPAYICASVVQTARAADLLCRFYNFVPAADEPPDWPPFTRREEVLLSINVLGFHGPESAPPPDWPNENRIEDHTHDPWSRLAAESSAGYCVASLRKTLPVPDGGALWSPLGLPCPSPDGLIPRHAASSQQKLTAMLLKRHYLLGMPVQKEEFRAWQIQSEAAMSIRPISRPLPITASMLPHLPWQRWRAERARNAEYGARRLRELLTDPAIEPNRCEILPRPSQLRFPRQCPFAVVLVCSDRRERDRLREALIQRQVYPPIFWPLPKEAARRCPKSAAFSARMLALPCDFRYTPEDIEEAVQIVREFFRHGDA